MCPKNVRVYSDDLPNKLPACKSLPQGLLGEPKHLGGPRQNSSEQVPHMAPPITTLPSFLLGSARPVYFFFWLRWVFVAAHWPLFWGHTSLLPEPCGILVPRPGMKPTSPALEGRFLTTGPPGKSPVLSVSFLTYLWSASLP